MAENPRTRPNFQDAVTWGLFIKAIGILPPIMPLWMS